MTQFDVEGVFLTHPSRFLSLTGLSLSIPGFDRCVVLGSSLANVLLTSSQKDSPSSGSIQQINSSSVITLSTIASLQ